MLFTPLGTEFSSEGEGSLPLEEEEEEKTTSFDLREYVTGLTETGVYERGNAIAMKPNLAGEASVTEHESNSKF